MAMDLTAWTAGEDVDQTILQSRIRGNFQAIAVSQSYTPTMGGTGWAKGANGTVAALYVAYTNRIQVGIVFTLGTLSSGGSGGLTFSAPAGPTALARTPGEAQFVKGGSTYIGQCSIIGSTISLVCTTSAAGLGGILINGAPSAGNWGNTDVIALFLDYFI